MRKKQSARAQRTASASGVAIALYRLKKTKERPCWNAREDAEPCHNFNTVNIRDIGCRLCSRAGGEKSKSNIPLFI